jgi:hypothetical protein
MVAIEHSCSYSVLLFIYVNEAHCNPGEKIQWHTVSWPTNSLSWDDFRGQVLGATDPFAAPKGSVRRAIIRAGHVPRVILFQAYSRRVCSRPVLQ